MTRSSALRILSIALLALAVFLGGSRLPLRAEGLSVQPAADAPPAAPLAALGSGFTYQGLLNNGGAPVNGNCDFQFGLYDALTSGGQLGSTENEDTVAVADGLFTVTLNDAGQFGANAFNGDARWLDIAVRCPAGAGGYTTLSPRQPVTPAPYAITSPGSPYANTVIVAKSGGDFTSIQSALDSITDASGVNRYLVWIAPGVYTETVTMKRGVDLEGAGELATKITFTGSAAEDTGTLVGKNNAEARFLTVENTGGANHAIAIYNNSASPRLTHLTATASGGTDSNFGVFNASASSPMMTNVTASGSGGTNNNGVRNYSSSSPTMTDVIASASGGTNNTGVFNELSSSPTMADVTATASGGTGDHYGVFNASASSPTMTNVTASASGGITSDTYGVYNHASSPTIQSSRISASGGTYNVGINNAASGGSHAVKVNNSQIVGTTFTVVNDTEFTVRVGASQLDGGTVTGGGFTCVGVYDENYAALNAACS